MLRTSIPTTGEAKDLTKTEQFAAPTGKEQSILTTTGRGYYILGVLGAGEEPTNHALKDIIAEREVFEHWGRNLVLLFKDKTSQGRYRPEDFAGLPKGTVFGLDDKGTILSELVTNMSSVLATSLSSSSLTPSTAWSSFHRLHHRPGAPDPSGHHRPREGAVYGPHADLHRPISKRL